MSHTKRPWMRLWCRRLMASTTWQNLDAAGRGVYLELIMEAFVRDEPLPKDEDELRLMARATEDEWSRAWPIIKRKFKETEGGLVNSVVEDEKTHFLSLSKAGAKGNEMRWKGGKLCKVGTPGSSPHPIATRSPGDRLSSPPDRIKKEKEKEKEKEKKNTHTNRPPLPPTVWGDESVLSKLRKPKRKKKAKKAPVVSESCRAWFYDEFWPHYPVHAGEDEAIKAAARRIKPEEREAVVAALKDQLTWPEDLTFGLNPKRSKLPHALRWITDRRWKDEGPAKSENEARREREKTIERLRATKAKLEEDRSGW